VYLRWSFSILLIRLRLEMGNGYVVPSPGAGGDGALLARGSRPAKARRGGSRAGTARAFAGGSAPLWGLPGKRFARTETAGADAAGPSLRTTPERSRQPDARDGFGERFIFLLIFRHIPGFVSAD